MAFKGKLIPNPRTGEYVEFLQTNADTGGACTQCKILQKAGGFRPAMHYHLEQDENFQVLEGELSYVIGDRRGTIKAGESITMPRAVPHTHYNDRPTDLLMVQTISPSLDFDLMLENFFGLAAEGKVPNGEPHFLQLLMWLRCMKTKNYLARVPRFAQDFLAFALAPVGRLLGYKPVYQRFSGYDG